MAVRKFTYYAYDNYERSETTEVLEGKGLSSADAALVSDEVNGIQVALDYEFDDVTKRLTLVRARPA